MGVTVHAWLAGEPLRRWGVGWLDGGSMSLRYRQPLEVGDPLTLALEHQPSTLTFELLTPAGKLVASGDASLDGPPVAPVESFGDAPVPEPRLARLPEALDSRALGYLEFDFSEPRDLAFHARLDPDDPYRELRVAHPAWIGTGVNALIAQSIDMPPKGWTHAGTAMSSL
jgi:hypothetical protein